MSFIVPMFLARVPVRLVRLSFGGTLNSDG